MGRKSSFIVIGILLFFHFSFGLTMAILSSGKPVEEYKRYKPLSKYISEELGEPVKLIIVGQVSKLLDMYEHQKIDISITCPIVYFELKEKENIDAVAVVKINGQILESGVIVVKENSNIKTIQDLRDKRVTLGSSICASNCVMPLYVLSKEGITYKDIPGLWSSGSDKAAILAVIAGLADAAGVKEESAKKFIGKGIRILTKSPYVPRYVVNLSKNISQEKFNKIKNILFRLNDEEILKKVGIDGFVEPPNGLLDILKGYKSILKRYPMLQ